MNAKIERFIKKKKTQYLDTRSETNTEKLKDDLHSVHNIMS